MPNATEDSTDAVDLVRPVGPFERLLFRYGMRNAVHFTVVAEFGMRLDIELVKQSLRAVQRRHPLLSVHVEDRPGGRLGFYRPRCVAPVDLVVRGGEDYNWTSLVSSELTRPFDRSHAPLIRAVVAINPTASALLLTFDHTVADGISSMVVLSDVVAGLSGSPMTHLPVPASQEQLIDLMLPNVEEFDDSKLAPSEGRLSRPKSLRPSDEVPTQIQVFEMGESETACLVHRCHVEETTVHGAIVTAASRVRSLDHGEYFPLRVQSPIDFRSQINAVDDCANYFMASLTEVLPWENLFWDVARSIPKRLAISRSPRGIVMSSRQIRQAMPIDADARDAERLFTSLMPHDLLITNLGVRLIPEQACIRPLAIWGPFTQSHMEGEHVLGVVTYDGKLRMAACGYNLKPGFLRRVSDYLTLFAGR